MRLSPLSDTASCKATHCSFGHLGGKRISQSQPSYAGGRAGRPRQRLLTRHPLRGGVAPSFRTRERSADLGISRAQGYARFPPRSWIKRVRRSRGATEPAQPALPPALALQAPPPRHPELSTMARAATAAAARSPSLLRAALLLLLLAASCRRAAGEARSPGISREGQETVGAHCGDISTNPVCCPRRGARGQ